LPQQEVPARCPTTENHARTNPDTAAGPSANPHTLGSAGAHSLWQRISKKLFVSSCVFRSPSKSTSPWRDHTLKPCEQAILHLTQLWISMSTDVPYVAGARLLSRVDTKCSRGLTSARPRLGNMPAHVMCHETVCAARRRSAGRWPAAASLTLITSGSARRANRFRLKWRLAHASDGRMLPKKSGSHRQMSNNFRARQSRVR
jgi:hypothetical protein